MDDRKKLLVVAISFFVSLFVIGGALSVAMRRKASQDAPVVAPHSVSQAELAAGNGINGHPCLVAVDGTVYQIRGFSQWQNGKHANSNGEAYCGADMTKIIGRSPHGRTVLRLLIKVGLLS
jgi:predicted heme/steroid binding protein